MFPGALFRLMRPTDTSVSFPAIAFVGAEENAGSTVTIPAGHQAGDLMVMFAWREGTGTPAAPGGGGWTLKTDASRTGFADKNFRTYSKVASGGSETSGTWSEVFGLHCHVYRNASGLGAGAIDSDGSSNPDLPALTLDVTDGTSRVAAFAFHVGASTSMSASGMSARSQLSSVPTTYWAGTWDSPETASWAGKANIGSTGSDWASCSVELLKTVA
jgi:hypothetical protein